MRRALAPLARLAEERDLAVLALIHFNKAPGADALARVSGSIAFTAGPRSVLVFGADPGDPDGERGAGRVLAHEKCNVGPRAPSLAWRLEGREIEGEGHEKIATSRLVEVGECETRASELLDSSSADRSEVDEAVEFLEGQLAEGERPRREVKAAWEDEGGAERTLQRAAAKLEVEEDSRGFPRRTYWRLPVAPTSPGETGEQEGGANGETRTVERKTEDSPSQSRQASFSGATGRGGCSGEAAEADNLVPLAGGHAYARMPNPAAGSCACGRPTSPTYARCLRCDIEAVA